ncbi:multisubunit Na+/H+ antiporter, MnhC subunit [Aciduliprofundum sp. MAR08-339]|uniref:sodium:proton antiporter n=1 Tax=Aciduliprofundum sp. (strain MAR08-339) TaxID=673860 RepID=UPI0002A4B1B8|nr:multisubunit Na+/H+ antiporter, MnhC subunit [Aciduliprofundum sp. MAR08-339]
MTPYYYLGSLALIAIGIYIVIAKRNLIKIIIGLDIMDTGVNLLLISVGYVKGGTAPIENVPGPYVDPVPQALVLTAIVIGVSVMALALSIAIGIYKNTGTMELDELLEVKK